MRSGGYSASKGSDISMLVAHAFREMAKASDIAIQNGGGVLTDIAKGDLTMVMLTNCYLLQIHWSKWI